MSNTYCRKDNKSILTDIVEEKGEDENKKKR
jgi:hypothetical protein